MYYVDLPTKKVPIVYNADVVVCGGGAAGIASALGSAQNGARTLLIERNGFLGGIVTAGLNASYMGWDRNVTGGLARKILDALLEEGQAVEGFHSPFDPEAFKAVSLRLLVDSSARILFYSSVVDVIKNGENIEGVIIQNRSGYQAVTARVVVDATGDADIAALAGTPMIDDVQPTARQPVTLLFRLGGVDIDKTVAYLRKHPEEMHSFPLKCALNEHVSPPLVVVSGFFKCFTKAKAEKSYSPERLAFGMTCLPNNQVLINGTRLHGIDATDAWALTEAEINLRKQVDALFAFLKDYVPGYKDAYIIDTAAVCGVRESRRVKGEYVLEEKDLTEGAKFSDAIGRNNCPMDIHGPPEAPTDHRWIVLDSYYQLPYRCLLPVQHEKLLVAGRCISATYEAHSSTRSIPCCMTTGLAAGTAAAVASADNLLPRQIEIAKLQNLLRKQGSII